MTYIRICRLKGSASSHTGTSIDSILTLAAVCVAEKKLQNLLLLGVKQVGTTKAGCVSVRFVGNNGREGDHFGLPILFCLVKYLKS